MRTMHLPAPFLQFSGEKEVRRLANSWSERRDTCTKRDGQTNRAASREDGRISGGRV